MHSEWLSHLRMMCFVGFILIGIGVVLPFVRFPLAGEATWIKGGVGIPVLLACIAGMITVLRRTYFPALCIAFFVGFFLFLEVLIAYDMESIRLATNTTPTAPFRYVFEIFADAFAPKFGAFYVLLGSLVLLAGASGGLLLNNVIAPISDSDEEIGEMEHEEDDQEEYDLEEGEDPPQSELS